MLNDFECPICKRNYWQLIEKYSYSKYHKETINNTKYSHFLRGVYFACRTLLFAKPRKSISSTPSLNQYQKLRRKVLFDVWVKDEIKVVIKSILCKKCGFVCYTPRPDEEDIKRKYEYLKKTEPNQGGQSGNNRQAKNLDMKRAFRLFNKCSKYFTKTTLNVLDYGGGNGKLLYNFIKNGHNCYIIDFNDNPIKGAKKLGNNINDARIEKKFDIVICSHVLEHVSDLSNLVTKLKEQLKSNGIIYAEVPQEIWAGLRIDDDPVTHVNFFSLNSFLSLFTYYGFRILEQKQTISNYGNSYKEVIWVVAQVDEQSSPYLQPPDTGKMLYPARLYSAIKLFRLIFEGKIRYRLNKL